MLSNYRSVLLSLSFGLFVSNPSLAASVEGESAEQGVATSKKFELIDSESLARTAPSRSAGLPSDLQNPTPMIEPAPSPAIPTKIDRIFAHPNWAPDAVYRSAWQFVRDYFYEPTYNGQDWSRWEQRYQGKLKTDDDANLAVATMIASLGDKDAQLIPWDFMGHEKFSVMCKYGGVGLFLERSNIGTIDVLATFQRTPAYRAGLQAGDRIIQINGKPVQAWLPDASSQIRGTVGTNVELTVLRANKKVNFKLQRDDVPVFCVFDSRMLNDEIGYIRIDTLLSQKALDDVLQNLEKLNSAKGIIIDLRGNAAGLHRCAKDVATLFLEKGVITSIADRWGYAETEYRVDKDRMSSSEDPPRKLPLYNHELVILVDGNTARAAEILTAALKYNGRAEIVGAKTRGRGLVQVMFRLPNGLKLCFSQSRFLTPANTDILLGVEPDHYIEVSKYDQSSGRGPWYSYGSGSDIKDRTPGDMKDLQLVKAYEVLKARIKRSNKNAS